MSTSIYKWLPILVLAVAVARKALKKSRPPLPPGPKPIPLLGNLHQFPQHSAWLGFKEWRHKYGDVVYARALGKSTLILNSHKACVDLLDKRSAIYSDRPRMVMISELMQFSWSVVVHKYSTRWRQHRRLFHQFYNENASKDYLEVQERCAHNFLRRLVHTPEDFLEHTRLFFAEPVLSSVYGIEASSYDNEYVQLIEKTMSLIGDAMIPGRFLVDLLPILKYVPSWFPGAGFKRFANSSSICALASRDIPAAYVAERVKNGSAPSSTVYSRMLEKCEQDDSFKRGSDESPADIAKNTAAVVYLVGSDTTLATIQLFLLLMANHPEVQRTAQAEIDSVVGNERLPSFSDMEDLPYISAIIKEVLRWHPVVPSGVAHSLTEDDVYEGYFIPKGTVVLPNLWLILHDPEVYPDPDLFNPSRWLIETPNGTRLNKAIPDPDAAFGYGRRICPGRHYAHNALFGAVSSVLACFKISPLDDSGNPCERVPEEFIDGIITYPKPFKASIVPRSDRVTKLLNELDD